MREEADDGHRDADETRPLDLGVRPRPIADPEPAVAEALAVVQRAIRDLATSGTRPLLDPPPTPFRFRRIGDSDLGVFPVILDAGAAGGEGGVALHGMLDAHAGAGGNALLVEDAADGRAAQSVGAWLGSRRRRDATVVLGRLGRLPALTSTTLPEAVDRLLRRLGTDRIDVLVLPDGARGTSLEETLTAAAGLVQAGKVGCLAASGFSAERLIQARVTAGQRGLPRFEAVLPPLNLLAREAYERAEAPVVHAQGLSCLPVSPLAGGFLAGAVGSRTALKRLRELDPDRAERLQPAMTRRGLKVVEALLRIAEARHAEPATVALAWLLTRPHVTAPVVAARTPEQVRAAAAAASLHLSRAEAAALERA